MFTTYPENYSSLYSELLYSYSTDSSSESSTEEEGDLTLYIVDVATDDILGVKKFYASTTAQINIAPIVRSYAYPSVVTAESGFVTDSTSGTIEVVVADDNDLQSESRRFTLSRSSENQIGLLSTLPALKRTMVLGESELLTFRVDPTKSVTVTQSQFVVEYDSAVGVKSYAIDAQESGFVTFNIVADPLDEISSTLNEESLDSLELTVKQGDETIAQIQYIVVDPPVDPIRLAWISSRGSIEHYTFPVVSQRSYEGAGGDSLTISSAYELYEVRRAIAEVIESPKVWIALDTGGYLEVEVESESVDLSAMSDIGCVELKISYCNE